MVWSMSKGKIDSGNVLELDQEHFTRINFMHHRFIQQSPNQITSQYFSFEVMGLFATLKKIV